MPDSSAWKEEYRNDKNCAKLISMVADPAQITVENVNTIHSTYRDPIRQSQIKWEQDQLILHEPITHSTSKLQAFC
jgi:hypothetical protein